MTTSDMQTINSTPPTCSVLMSVYNDGAYLRAAIDSILTQTIPDFEFIIVNDGSTDETAAILDSYTDPRIKRLDNAVNIGLTRSLNRGLALATGRYIARLDANDIAMPDRLARQSAYLDANPDVGMVSGDMIAINAEGERLLTQPRDYARAASHAYLRWQLLFNNPIAHITVMLRHSVLQQHQLGYDPDYNRAEDYDLWARLGAFTKLARLAEPFVYRRVLSDGISFSRREQQLAVMYRISARELCNLVPQQATPSATQTLFALYHTDLPSASAADVIGATRLVLAAYQASLSPALSDADRRLIQGDVVGYLLKLSRYGVGRGRRAALYPLWALRHASLRELMSRNTLKHFFRACFPPKRYV